MKFSPYSFSKIDIYDTCPRKFKFTYIIKPPAIIVSNIALQRGSYLHHCLENYPEGPTNFYKLEQEQIDVCDAIIKNFLNSDIGISIFSQLNISKEQKFGISKEFKLCNFFDKNSLLRGSIDRLDRIGNMLHIIDFKSGKYKEPQYQSYKQVMAYAIWVFRNEIYNDISEIKCSYVYIEHNKENSIIFKREQLLNYAKEYANSINAIENDTEFKKKESRLCEWCDYMPLCLEPKSVEELNAIEDDFDFNELFKANT